MPRAIIITKTCPVCGKKEQGLTRVMTRRIYCSDDCMLIGSSPKKSKAMMGNKHLQTHGLKHKKSYSIWVDMLRRCNKKDHRAYKDYGGRGIKVCKRWHSVEKFYKDMGEKPEGLTLDRVDNNKGYNKKNCRWATNEEQANNRRDNVFITAFGQTMTVAQWSRKVSVNETTIARRLRAGWSDERALSAPRANEQEIKDE